MTVNCTETLSVKIDHSLSHLASLWGGSPSTPPGGYAHARTPWSVRAVWWTCSPSFYDDASAHGPLPISPRSSWSSCPRPPSTRTKSAANGAWLCHVSPRARLSPTRYFDFKQCVVLLSPRVAYVYIKNYVDWVKVFFRLTSCGNNLLEDSSFS